MPQEGARQVDRQLRNPTPAGTGSSRSSANPPRQDSEKLRKRLGGWDGDTKTQSSFKLAPRSTLTTCLLLPCTALRDNKALISTT